MKNIKKIQKQMVKWER